MFTTSQAADRLGIVRDVVSHYCRIGRLRATKIGRDWMILPTDLATFAAKPRQHNKFPIGRKNPAKKKRKPD